MEDLTEIAIDYLTKTKLSDLPKDVQECGKRMILDSLGALIAGTETPVAQIMRDYVTQEMGGTACTLLVTGQKVSCTGAALGNGFAGNALDIDDSSIPTLGHISSLLFPALLSAGEKCSKEKGCISGSEFLRVYIICVELATRAGIIRHARYECYHSSGSWGAIAAAAGCALFLGGDKEIIRHAMGAGESHAPICPMMKCIDSPSMPKDGLGWGAMVGVSNAQMALLGFTGIKPIFEDAPDTTIVTNLGTKYEIRDTTFKPYAGCLWAQAAIAAALQLQSNHAWESVEEIESLIISTFYYACTLSQAPPKDTEQAQYSLNYQVASAIIYGQVGPKEILPPLLHNPQVLALLTKIQVVENKEYSAAHAKLPRKYYAHLSIRLQGGKQLDSGRFEPKWREDDLPSNLELQDKFRWLVHPIIGEKNAQVLIEMISNIQDLKDIAQIVSYCIKG